ncbi:MAG: metallophosphoesterase family protein [Candidatus Helarchaeota archaeon]
MKFLAFSDFHGLFGYKNYFVDVKQKIKKYSPDFVILCGDFRNKISINRLEMRVKHLELPVYYVWGNDDEFNIDFKMQFGKNCHLEIFNLNDENFWITGIGGDEYDMVWNISKFKKILQKNISSLKNFILISHVPPYSICDKTVDGKHAGVKEYLDLILEFRPKLVLFGHIHENWYKTAKLKNIIFQNVGPKGVYFQYDNAEFTIINLS